MRAVDTNVLVRLVVADEPQQAVIAEQFAARGAWISVVNLAELTWVLRRVYKLPPDDIADAVEMLLGQEHLTLQDADVVAAALEVYRSRPALGFTDCLVVELARKAGHLPLGTFDQDLAKIDGAQLLQ
jgi:predicted nucleic-acid-binding protein